jgi:threonine efflux protein
MSFVDSAALFAPLAVYAFAVPLPGPSFVVVAQASLGRGRLNGIVAALGTTLGVSVYAIATLLGLSTTAAALPWLVTVIQVLGGGYLVYLGAKTLRAALWRSNAPARVERPVSERHSIARTFGKALLVSLGNPKMAAFFFGLFAPVVGLGYTTDKRMFVLCGVILIDLIYHQALAAALILVGASGPFRRARRWLDGLVGALMMVFGLGLLVDAARAR